MMLLRFSGTVLLVLVAVAACGNSSKSTSEPVEAGKVFCDSQYNATPPKAMPFSAGMTAMSSDMAFKVQMTTDPALPVPGDYSTFDLKVTDASGAPVPTGTAVSLDCLMTHPGFTHHSPVPIQMTEMGGGVYEAKPVVFNMPGNWAVTVTVNSTKVLFPVCIG